MCHYYPYECDEIPEYLYYDGWKTDRDSDGKTPLM